MCASPRRGGPQILEGVIAPHVRVDDQEPLAAEQRKRPANASSGVEGVFGLPRISDAHSEPRPVTKPCRDQLAEPCEIDDDVSKAGFGEPPNLVLDERPAANLEQRLRHVVGQNAHALSAACGKDHRFHPNHPLCAAVAIRSRAACVRLVTSNSSSTRMTVPISG